MKRVKHIAMSPEGEIFQIANLKEFCAEQGWPYRSVHPNVSEGHGRYKGWVIKKATLKPEQVIEELTQGFGKSRSVPDTVSSIARKYGFEPSAILARMNKGMSLEEALANATESEFAEELGELRAEIVGKIKTMPLDDLKKIKLFLENFL